MADTTESSGPQGSSLGWGVTDVVRESAVSPEFWPQAAAYWKQAASRAWRDMLQWQFDPKSQAFVKPGGDTVPSEDQRRAVIAVVVYVAAEIRLVTTAMFRGKLPIRQWQRLMAALLKLLHGSVWMAGWGGESRMSIFVAGPPLEDRLMFQFERLENFAAQLARGHASAATEAMVLARAELYAHAAYPTWQAARARSHGLANEDAARDGDNPPFGFEVNVLGVAEHCEGVNSCIQETGRGWVPYGSLIPIGQRLCGPNCKCHLRYAMFPPGVIDADNQ